MVRRMGVLLERGIGSPYFENVCMRRVTGVGLEFASFGELGFWKIHPFPPLVAMLKIEVNNPTICIRLKLHLGYMSEVVHSLEPCKVRPYKELHISLFKE